MLTTTRPTMARLTGSRLIGFRGFMCAAIAVVWALGGRAWPAESLQLVTDRLPPFEDLDNDKAPGFSVEVLRQVFAAMGQDASFERFPWDRSWRMVYRGERDGMFTALRTSERERICYFPDEPLKQERWVFFVRTADVGKLKFSSFDDLVGHDIAVHGPADGVLEQPTVSPELWKFLTEHHNMVETFGTGVSFRMLAAGRVDYAVANLTTGIRYIDAMGLSGKIEPLLSRSVIEDGFSVCFSKARVSPSLVEAFSRALKEFKQTEAFQAIYRKYFP
jgi:polar amino acid transport system substrate-binding protein